VLLLVAPARAGSILYATAASQQRIDGFCLGSDGALLRLLPVTGLAAGR